MDELSSLLDEHGSISVSPDLIHIIETPQEFYKRLLELTRNATKRITLSTLYIGEGRLEKDFVYELEKALERHSNLRMNILIDYLRGTRGGPEKGSVALLKSLIPRACIYLFHTPSLRGWLKKLLPERSNEIIGLQHMKLYIFDDNVLISGANLSETYFTNRQDRYILIRNCERLADFLDDLVQVIISCSFCLKDDDALVLHENCDVHPFNGSMANYCSMVQQRVQKHLKTFPMDKANSSLESTRIYPFVQMGVFSINQEYDFLCKLFAIQDTKVKMTLASGYFNLIDDYASLISRIGKYSMDVIFASPQANGFYNGAGLSNYIPSIYVTLSERFFLSTRPEVRLFEYSRPSWSFHGKGLWVDFPQSNRYGTLVGSSNYGFRSVRRDLEAQLLIVTNNENLKFRLKKEHQRILKHCNLVEAATFIQPDHRIPMWVRIFSRSLRHFF